ncbi:carbohydrate ABC transporter permease [Fimbriimonas ginsengisoli]|uniref:Sugar ABC transporter permease n=1 Tax=Fimbriimonas ginsengisoli Gsoil 348 TaxID=661478 RepID=A0A068NR85_FIMGI|nr:sugar ABC transporter permease [Fimbriimonas ginsengisoli]AIE84084.1 sugar ABC transporter permease [Fimbriimonas ginsengisoli Gsoil 348]
MTSLTKKQAWAGFLFASPWLVGFSVFLAYPLIASMYYSFCDYSVLKPPVPIGFENYRELAGDELFWKALVNTFIYAVMAIPTGMATALILAMLLNAKVKGMAIYRTLFFIPALVPQVSLAVLWLWVLNGEHGVLNVVLAKFHIPGPNWLTQPAWTKPSMVLMSLWGVGNSILIYLASLQDVPQALLEAADLDGANGWQRTKNVTLPMISPVILFNGIMGLIGSLQIFTVPYIMFTNGNPARSSYFYTAYLYDSAFKYHKMGYASAMGWIMFIIILILTFVSLKLSDRHVHYQGS